MAKSEIRKHYFKEAYVIIAPNRAKRPQTTIKKQPDSGSGGECFLCPATFANKVITYRDNNSDGDWDIISSVNKYPAVSLDNPDAYGQAEVIVETRTHSININELPVEQIVRVFDAYINRYTVLKNLTGIKHVIVFKNEGGKAGASIDHSHSQVIALPILPPKAQSEIEAYDRYVIDQNSCPYCDIIAKEIDGPRMIWKDKNLFVVAPYASESPYGAWFIPRRHMTSIADLSSAEKESFAKALKVVLGKLDELDISYNYFIENTVGDKDYHMHIKLSPRPNVWAGLELGTGVIVNPIAPEEAAKIYREK